VAALRHVDRWVGGAARSRLLQVSLRYSRNTPPAPSRPEACPLAGKLYVSPQMAGGRPAANGCFNCGAKRSATERSGAIKTCFPAWPMGRSAIPRENPSRSPSRPTGAPRNATFEATSLRKRGPARNAGSPWVRAFWRSPASATIFLNCYASSPPLSLIRCRSLNSGTRRSPP